MKWPVLAVMASIGAVGCRSTASGPYNPPDTTSRETAEAERLSREAAAVIATDPEKSEGLLRESLSKDLFFGPAHNNLGIVFLKQGKLYEAAGEFEWARKLMPGHPDPRVNLAITLERAGKTEDALATYTAALEVYPDYLPAIEGLASLTARAGKHDDHMQAWLKEIGLHEEDSRWRAWAAERLSLGR
jgi:tetratricopeptide (TPR) repeat protein